MTMVKGIAWFFVFLSLSSWGQTPPVKSLTRIAFGSCNDQRDAQPVWKDLIQMNPDLFIWGGDAIYADWEASYDIKNSYDKQFHHADYADFRSRTPIIGTWDDHDFAFDNADGSFKQKAESQKYFLDFLEESESSPRRQQEGVYTSYEYNSEGKTIKVILLDNRYFKNIEKEYPLLGKKQWDWFEAQLKDSKADMHIIIAGLSIFSPRVPVTEEWADNPNEINRMLRLLRTHQPKGALFLSGDKHFASIFQRYGQLEFMSSGMTHVAPKSTWWFLTTKYPKTYFGLNYGLIDIDWEFSSPVITLSIRTPAGQDIHKTRYRWAQSAWIPI
jgi:alkaline phosphatase D